MGEKDPEREGGKQLLQPVGKEATRLKWLRGKLERGECRRFLQERPEACWPWSPPEGSTQSDAS